MTEVLGRNELANGNAVRYQAAILFDASPNLRNVITGIMNDEGKAWLGNRALTLASRTMAFRTVSDLQIFKGRKVDQLVSRSDSALRRVDIQPGVAWETVTTPRGELNRLYFEPAPDSANELERLYASYAAEYGQKAYTPGDTHDKMLSETLAYTIPSSRLKVDQHDGISLLREAMTDGTHASSGLYVGNSRFKDQRIS